MYQERPWREHLNTDLSDAETLSYLRGAVDDLLGKHGGKYTETLSVRGDGHLAVDRVADSKPSLIVTLFTERLGDTSQLRGPTVEEFYRLLSKLREQMPDLSFQISEDRERQTLTYTVGRPQVTS